MHYRKKKLAVANLQNLISLSVKGEIDLQSVRSDMLPPFPILFCLAALNLEGNRIFVVILFV